MRYRSFLILILGLFAATSLAAQEPSAIDRLTGQNSKIWIVTALSYSLGSEKKCEDGHEFEFAKSGVVIERICENGTVQQKESPWTHSNDGIDDFIAFDGNTFRLIVSTQKDPDNGIEYEEAILRREGEKTDGTNDLVLTRVP